MSLKALLASLGIIVLLTFGSVSAQASTSNYNFSFTSGGVSVTGYFLNVDDATGLIGGISGVVVGTGHGYDGTIGGMLPVRTYAGNNNILNPNDPYFDTSGVSFYTGANPADTGAYFNLWYAGGLTPALLGTGVNPTGSLTVSLDAAPEIDGSLMPQVLLLLGGAIVLFRRNPWVCRGNGIQKHAEICCPMV